MTLLPELAVPRQRTQSDTVKYIPFSDPGPSRRIGMLYRQGSYREQTYQKIAQLIKEQFL
jgi:LysR family hydrogen peroxide-inducible transcriptional activator